MYILIVFRNVATAFLKNGNDFLLSKRSKHKKIGAGAWYGVGGHLEESEINNPYEACLREIHEETGIGIENISRLKLKYVLLAKRDNGAEIVINYIYFGSTTTREVVDSDEGKLYWVPKKELMDMGFVDPIRTTINHYLEFGEAYDDVLVGVLRYEGSKVFVNWNEM